jgi:tetratricopeptide (TPR) repeat protein
MINLPPNLTPSELLCCEELPPHIDKLLHVARSLRVEGRWLEAERCARDAVEISQEIGTHVNRGAALIHLSDVYREMGRLGPALADCQKAYRIFRLQPSHYQRQNEAVAAYALGLIHQLLGSEMDALKWYQASWDLFERVREDWATVDARDQVKTCTRVQGWVETLSEYLTAVRTRTEANLVTSMWVPIILSEGEEREFAVAELKIDRYVVAGELEVEGKALRVHLLKGTQPLSLATGVDYYALGIPNEARELLGASEGDYALVVQEKNVDREGPGVVKTLGGLEFGRFERDEEDNIKFVGTDATVIGGRDMGDDLQFGYITALLKPT